VIGESLGGYNYGFEEGGKGKKKYSKVHTKGGATRAYP
jgi:hypothetical protein